LQSAIPAKALKKDWTDQQRKAWAASLKAASEPVQVLQVDIHVLVPVLFFPTYSFAIRGSDNVDGSPATKIIHFGGLYLHLNVAVSVLSVNEV
jgi:hypothetical protein